MKQIFTLLMGVGFTLSAAAQDFTSGNLVVYRVGTGAAALTNAAQAVFLDEYNSAGTLQQSLAFNTTGTSSLTANGTATTEGMITRSSNGQYIIVPGYRADVGSSNPASATSATVPRVIGRVSLSKTVDVSTALNIFSGSNIRSATSTNGNDLWAAGGNTGTVYATLGSTTSGTVIASTTTNQRCINVCEGQLFMSTASGSVRFATIGTGTPNTTGQTITTLAGLPTATISPYQFILLDQDPSISGVDVLYYADDNSTGSTGGLVKYTYNNTNSTWELKGRITTASLRGITARINGANVEIYGTNNTNIYSFTDNSGQAGDITGGSMTSIATAPTNTAFRGIAFTPENTPAPIKFGAYNLSVVNNNVVINWETKFEQNVNEFSVERSANGTEFSTVGTVAATNKVEGSKYSFTDVNPIDGVSYYRIKSTDFDGKTSYTKTLIANTKKTAGIKLFGNPVRNNIVLSHDKAAKGSVIRIYNSIGSLLQTINVQEGATQTSGDVSKLISGSYLAIFEANGVRQNVQFVKQ